MLRNLVLSTLLAAAALTGCSTDQDQTVDQGSEMSAPAAQIFTADDLASYLRTAKGSPLDRLSPAAKQRFLDSLVFGAGGLGSYSYTDLQAELSPTEIHAILSLFGVEHTTWMVKGAQVKTPKDKVLMMKKRPGGPLGDHDGYRCQSVGTCVSSMDSICTDNC